MGGIGEVASPLYPFDVLLAATLHSAHLPPRTQPSRPFWLTDSFYKGSQEDAGEFVARLLNPVTTRSLAPHLQGRMAQSLLCKVAGCGHSRPSEGEAFGSLQLPLRTVTGGFVKHVQEALDAYMPDETVELAEVCSECMNKTDYVKKCQVTCFPEVLVIYLNRWSGEGVEGALLCPIQVSKIVHFRKQAYTLCGAVSHLGPSPFSGHYIAVTRHATNTGEWWLYDDEHRMQATEAQVSTMCSYGSWGPMQSYILVYERHATPP